MSQPKRYITDEVSEYKQALNAALSIVTSMSEILRARLKVLRLKEPEEVSEKIDALQRILGTNVYSKYDDTLMNMQERLQVRIDNPKPVKRRELELISDQIDVFITNTLNPAIMKLGKGEANSFMQALMRLKEILSNAVKRLLMEKSQQLSTRSRIVTAKNKLTALQKHPFFKPKKPSPQPPVAAPGKKSK